MTTSAPPASKMAVIKIKAIFFISHLSVIRLIVHA